MATKHCSTDYRQIKHCDQGLIENLLRRWPIFRTRGRQLVKQKQLIKVVIEKGALTCCQSVSVVAVINVNARYVVCILLPI